MDDMPDITKEAAELMLDNMTAEQQVGLYMAAWRFWRVVRQTDKQEAWLRPAAAIGTALDVEYDRPKYLSR